MDLASIRKTYRRYSRHYDRIFGPVFNPGRKLSVETANHRSGQRILEVGVGTGLALPYYHADCRVVGIDVSPEMLEKARQRRLEEKLDHVEDLIEMDAEHLDFPDHSFDSVVAMYVVSVVPNPGRLLAEMRRVCKPDGDIVLINHFSSSHPVLKMVEKSLSPLSGMLGFRPNLDLQSLPGLPGFEVADVRSANFLGYWKMVHYRGTSERAI
jgi:phosphatidylethanolamine/phosphatidyl-N-methylethanolamine N-methyltransferase